MKGKTDLRIIKTRTALFDAFLILLREKQFEIFLQELNQEEMKEIDQLISYQYNHSAEQEE